MIRETSIDVRIYFEDTDVSGVVYHANYLKYFERGRTESLRTNGFDHTRWLESETPLAFTLRDLTIRYIAPARIDDLIRIDTNLVDLRGARMIFEQSAWLGDQQLAEARVTVACMDLTGRAKRLPKELLAVSEAD